MGRKKTKIEKDFVYRVVLNTKENSMILQWVSDFGFPSVASFLKALINGKVKIIRREDIK